MSSIYIQGVEQGAVAFDIFAKYREFIPWNSFDGFTTGGDAYAILPQGTDLAMNTGAVANNDAFIYSNGVFAVVNVVGKVFTVEIPLIYISSVTDVNVWLRLAGIWGDPPSEIEHHVGWKIIGADLYASNADGATQTITDTTVDIVPSTNQRTTLKIVLNPGIDCKFYVNDVLKVTHTTNLPTDNNLYLHFHMRTLANTSKSLVIGRALTELEY